MISLLNRFILVSVCLITLSSCFRCNSSKSNEENNDTIAQNVDSINGGWTLTKFHQNGVTIDRSNPVFIPSLEIDQDKMKVNGGDGCNRIFATLTKLNNEELLISTIAGTKVGCKMKNPYDEEYRILLERSRTYKITSSNLVLFDKEGIRLLAFEKMK